VLASAHVGAAFDEEHDFCSCVIHGIMLTETAAS
jgi:hypothetical protein